MSFNQPSGYAVGFGSNISFGAINYSGGVGTVALYNSGSGSSAAHVAQTIDINTPDDEIGSIKVTNNDSPNPGGNPAGAHEMVPGMTSPGTTEYSVVYVKSKHEAIMQLKGNGVIYGWQEVFPDGTIYTFPGFIASASIEGKTEDEALMGKIKIQATSPGIWS